MRSNTALLIEGTATPTVSSSCAFRITFITASAYMSLVGLATHCRVKEGGRQRKGETRTKGKEMDGEEERKEKKKWEGNG